MTYEPNSLSPEQDRSAIELTLAMLQRNDYKITFAVVHAPFFPSDIVATHSNGSKIIVEVRTSINQRAELSPGDKNRLLKLAKILGASPFVSLVTFENDGKSLPSKPELLEIIP